jgi:hypothetical protein
MNPRRYTEQFWARRHQREAHSASIWLSPCLSGRCGWPSGAELRFTTYLQIGKSRSLCSRLSLACFCVERLYANRDGLLAGGRACCCRWSTCRCIDLLSHEEALHCAPSALPDSPRVFEHSAARADVSACASGVFLNAWGVRMYRVGDEPGNTISS